MMQFLKVLNFKKFSLKNFLTSLTSVVFFSFPKINCVLVFFYMLHYTAGITKRTGEQKINK